MSNDVLYNNSRTLTNLYIFSLKGKEHLHPQRDVLHSKQPPDSDAKGQETRAERVLQRSDRGALQQHLHLKAQQDLKSSQAS